MNRWRGKTAVVTGANSGIGKAVTQALLASGINVIGLDLRTDEFSEIAKKNLVIEPSGNFYGLKCDVSREYDLQEAFNVINNDHQAVDILVNSAGIINYDKVIGEYS